MVLLGDLGSKISRAMRQMTNATVIDQEVLDSMLKDITRALLEADVNVKLVVQLRKQVLQRVDLEEVAAGVNKRKLIQKTVFEELCAMLDPGHQPVALKKGKSNVVMFVGLQGNGKTTSCAKYAYHHQRRGWRTALVCADTFRAGAFDQLKQNATKAKIPFYGSYTETDPVKIAVEGVRRFELDAYELIVVDTSGRHKQDVALFDEMEQMTAAIKPADIIYVMDSSIGQAAYDQALAFRNRVAVGSVIITKLDGHAKGGGALSAVSATHSPITFIGTGEHVDDFEPFATQNFVGRLLGLGDISGLVSSIKEAGLHDADVYKRMAEGQITLRNLYEHYQNIGKMGPLSKVIQKMPMVSELLPKGSDQQSQDALKRFVVTMDSMTNEELDNPRVTFDASRKWRIAKGAGVDPKLVESLLAQHKQFSVMIERFSKTRATKTGNLNELGKDMNKMLNPQLLKHFGGAGGMQNMIKQLSEQLPGGFK